MLGNVVFERQILEKDGDLPAVFLSDLVQAHGKASRMSELMAEIEKTQNMSKSFVDQPTGEPENTYRLYGESSLGS